MSVCVGVGVARELSLILPQATLTGRVPFDSGACDGKLKDPVISTTTNIPTDA